MVLSCLASSVGSCWARVDEIGQAASEEWVEIRRVPIIGVGKGVPWVSLWEPGWHSGTRPEELLPPIRGRYHGQEDNDNSSCHLLNTYCVPVAHVIDIITEVLLSPLYR